MGVDTKIALVTGASRGIGAQIAYDLGKAGYLVVGTATSDAGAESITGALQEFGGKGFKLDVNVDGDVGRLYESISREFGGSPAILVNNAGVTRDNLFIRMSIEQWQEVIDTNLSSVFKVTQPAIKSMMKARWGRIICIGSVVAASGNPGQANYCASKAGLEGFCRSLSLELSSRSICINVISPGFITTDMTKSLTNEQHESIIQKVPMRRMGTPQDISAMVCYLSAEGGDYITGQTIHINGGMY